MKLQVRTDAFPDDLLAAARAEWPSVDWPVWFRYDDSHQRKRAAWELGKMPLACRHLIGLMSRCPPAPNLTPDLSLYGGGMHFMVPGDYVRVHLDADAHRQLGLERLWSTMLYLETCDGGELQIGSTLIRPHPGLLCSFECGQDAYHSVAEVRGGSRMSLALFWFGDPLPVSQRERAEFTGM